MHNDWHSSDWVLFAAAWTRILYVAMLSILLQNLTYRFWNLQHTRAIIMVFSREIRLQRPCTIFFFFTCNLAAETCTSYLFLFYFYFLHVKSGCGDPALRVFCLFVFFTWNPAAETLHYVVVFHVKSGCSDPAHWVVVLLFCFCFHVKSGCRNPALWSFHVKFGGGDPALCKINDDDDDDDDVELNVLGCRVDILGTNCDQCVRMVQCCFTSTETVRLIRTESPGRPPRLSHSSWTLNKINCSLFFSYGCGLEFLLANQLPAGHTLYNSNPCLPWWTNRILSISARLFAQQLGDKSNSPDKPVFALQNGVRGENRCSCLGFPPIQARFGTHGSSKHVWNTGFSGGV